MSKENDVNSIFRAEALQHKREVWFGPSRIHIPSNLSIFLFVGFITAFLVVLLIVFGSYSERVNATGSVVFDPPAVVLTAQSDGIVKYSAALEGKKITRDEHVFSVSGDTKTSFGDTNVEMVKLLKKQHNALYKKIKILAIELEETKSYLAARIKNKEQEIESLMKLIKNSEKNIAWFEKKSNQYSNFRGKGIALDAELIERTKDYYTAIESLSSSKVKYIIILGELLELKNKYASLERESHEKKESFNIEIANINQKILDAEKNKEYLIVAPFDGTITSVTAHVGQRVKTGQSIAVLVPHGAAPKVELLSSSDSLGEVADGQKVKMRVTAYPYKWYGKVRGIIETISSAPINMTSQAQVKDDNNSEKGLFRIIVKPELTEHQRNISLLPGMEVETEIYVKTRKVYEWLFVPVKKIYERITDGIE